MKLKYAMDEMTKGRSVYLEHVLSSSDCSDLEAYPTIGNLPEEKGNGPVWYGVLCINLSPQYPNPMPEHMTTFKKKVFADATK